MEIILSTFESGSTPSLRRENGFEAQAGIREQALPTICDVLRTLCDWELRVTGGLVEMDKRFRWPRMDQAREFESACAQELSLSELSVKITRFADEPVVLISLTLPPRLSTAHLALESAYTANRISRSCVAAG